MDYFVESEPWVGLLSAFGVALALIGAIALRGASDRVRAIAAMAGAVLVGYVILRAFGSITSVIAFLAAGGFDEGGEGGRRVLDVILIAVGVAAGIAAVLYAHSRADTAAEDLAADALVTSEPADEADDVVDDVPPAYDEPDPYTLSRRRLVMARPWIDLGALVVAMALPLVSFGLPQGGVPNFGFHQDVTAVAAVYLVVSGIVTAAALLVVAARTDFDDPRPLAGCFGLLALRAIVVPIWPGFFANEFWSAFAFGLAAGLLMAGAFGLVKAAIPDDRSVVIFGALAALALVTLSTALSVRAYLNQGVFESSFDSDDVDVRIPDDVFPTELPTFPDDVFPTEFPSFSFPPAP